MNILVSACLLGVKCRYNGEGVLADGVRALLKEHHLIPVCPEQLGGLPTPRTPAEQREGRVFTRDGADVTEHYRRGAEQVSRLAALYHCPAALLKERSPSCGCGQIYDGTFSGALVPGNGVCAALLMAQGIRIYGESQVEMLRGEWNGSEGEERNRA